jgi:hypothetical protein
MPAIAYLPVGSPMPNTSKMMTTHAKTSYVITPTKTPVWFLVRTIRPPFYTILLHSWYLDILITKTPAFPVYLTSCSALSSDHLLVLLLVDTTGRSPFLRPPDRPDFRRTDWANLQARLEEGIPYSPELHDQVSIDTCIERLPGTILEALAAANPKSRPRNNPRSLIPVGIQDEIHLKNQLRR